MHFHYECGDNGRRHAGGRGRSFRFGPFDFVFIDADKGGYADYLNWAIRLCRPGALIVADNVVRKGEVVDPASDDPSARRWAP